jgi:cobyrinic acid a,c-diamide synthase
MAVRGDTVTIARIMIAGTNSGVGKTTITLGVMAGLTRLGYAVQPYKVGPDYIDPSYHAKATGNPGINLDTTLTSPAIIKESFVRYGTGKSIAIIEGVMGLFDGPEGGSDIGSSAEIARLLDCPVVLVIDAKAMARSAAAVALGFLNFAADINIVGLVINNVGSERHKRLLQDAFENFPIPVLGYLMRDSKLTLAERHLGLIPVEEDEDIVKTEIFAQEIMAQLDFHKLMELAEKAKENKITLPVNFPRVTSLDSKVKIALARDRAFNFYYWDGLSFLEELGAEFLPFSPLNDAKLPEDIDGIIIGGGFPELFLDILGKNHSLHQDIRQAHEQGMPIYAECGGYMYLCQGIYSFSGDYYPMTNIIPCQAVMGKKLAGMGYRQGTLAIDTVLGKEGAKVKGHEFHYSSLTGVPEIFSWALKLYNTRQEKWVDEGFAENNLLASYLHIQWRGLPELAQAFISKCKKYREKLKR